MDWRTEDAKRLPRGLEEVSHLFLSRNGSSVPAGASSDTSVDSPHHPGHLHGGDPVLTVVPRRFVKRDQLSALLKKETGALEEGLRVLDAEIPADTLGSIDLLAVDCRKQLVVIDVDDSPNEGLLLRGVGHFDWIVRNMAILRRMYPGQVLDFALEPRLTLIAPGFSLLLRTAARRITSPRIDCVRYQAVGVAGGEGVFFESVSG